MNELEQKVEVLNRLEYLASWWREAALNSFTPNSRIVTCMRMANGLSSLALRVRREIFG